MKKVRIDVFVFLFISILLLVLASFFDMEIANFLYNRTSMVCRFINVVAQIPTFVIMTFFCVGISNTRSKDGSLKSILSFLLGNIGAFIFGFLVGYIFLFNMDLYSITITIAVDIGINVCCYIIVKLIIDHDAENLRRISLVGLFGFVICMALGFLLISFINRAPYRKIDNLVNIFTPWYRPYIEFSLTGFLYRSFPSLVTMVSCFVIFLNSFTTFLRLLKKRKVIIMIIAYSWIFIVAISQLVLGYTYLSDVAISLILVSIVSIIVYYILDCLEAKKNHI
ncbi:MAG: phosphatase PAP2 family protein [Traorella sp.]